MKIFDCTTYFNEPLLFELRLNILDKHIDEFIVAEALYTHSGEEKKINFNKELYPKFKERIKHIVVENQPKNLIDINETNKQDNSVFRLNAAKRIEFQRNCLSSFFSAENANDWVIYSDSDEIPNLDQFEIKKTKKK